MTTILEYIDRITLKKCTTPWKLLILFAFTQIVVYFDIGAIAGSLRSIQSDLDLSSTVAGALGSFFMIGYLLCCPIVGILENQFSSAALILCGLCTCIIASFGTGFSFSTSSMIIARALMGAGEVFYISVSAFYVEQMAPPHKKTTWLGIFYAAIPLGIALGYCVSGVMSVRASWRITFFVESGFMLLPFFAYWFIAPDPRVFGAINRRLYASKLEGANEKWSKIANEMDSNVEGEDDPDISEVVDIQLDDLSDLMNSKLDVGDIITLEELTEQDLQYDSDGQTAQLTNRVPYGEKLRALITNPTYVLITAGNVCLNFVIGAFGYWSPTFVFEQIGIPLEYSNITVGMTTFITGIAGTMLGGILADKFGGVSRRSHILASLTMIVVILLIKTPLNFTIAFVHSVWLFIPLFAASEFLLFMLLTPINRLVMNVVHNDHKTMANSFQILCVHLLGDVPAPLVVGWLRDRWSFKVAVIFLSFCVLVASLFFACARVYHTTKGCSTRLANSISRKVTSEFDVHFPS